MRGALELRVVRCLKMANLWQPEFFCHEKWFDFSFSGGTTRRNWPPAAGPVLVCFCHKEWPVCTLTFFCTNVYFNTDPFWGIAKQHTNTHDRNHKHTEYKMHTHKPLSDTRRNTCSVLISASVFIKGGNTRIFSQIYKRKTLKLSLNININSWCCKRLSWKWQWLHRKVVLRSVEAVAAFYRPWSDFNSRFALHTENSAMKLERHSEVPDTFNTSSTQPTQLVFIGGERQDTSRPAECGHISPVSTARRRTGKEIESISSKSRLQPQGGVQKF